METDKLSMVCAGINFMEKFCALNSITPPKVKIHIKGEPGSGASCAWYRPDQGIHIWPHKCAHIGNGIRSWSYPGYIIDRTPFGVVQHELGHHIEMNTQVYSRPLLANWLDFEEEPITGYHGTGDRWHKNEKHAEDFAEMFRLFITNPQLLKAIRPETYHFLTYDCDFKPVEKRHWAVVLERAPGRIKEVARKRVLEARKEDRS